MDAALMDSTLRARAAGIRLLTCDVDGVLTDGHIYIDDHGHEFKAFHAADGLGLKWLRAAGIEVAWITGSHAPAVAHRARILGIPHLIQDVDDKLAPWRALREKLGIPAEACAHIGDDLPDLPLMTASGFAITVPHAPIALHNAAHYVTRTAGGCGAVRELCELILAAQNKPFDASKLRSA